MYTFFFFFFFNEKPRKQSRPLSKKGSQLRVLVGSKIQELSPTSLKHNKVSFPNTVTTGIKYALVLAAKIAFWTGTITAYPLSNLKNLSLIRITILLTSPRCLSWMCHLASIYATMRLEHFNIIMPPEIIHGTKNWIYCTFDTSQKLSQIWYWLWLHLWRASKMSPNI